MDELLYKPLMLTSNTGLPVRLISDGKGKITMNIPRGGNIVFRFDQVEKLIKWLDEEV